MKTATLLNPNTFLLVAADSRETLRDCDVWRVLSPAFEKGVGEKMKAWLLKGKPSEETAQAILAFQP